MLDLFKHSEPAEGQLGNEGLPSSARKKKGSSKDKQKGKGRKGTVSCNKLHSLHSKGVFLYLINGISLKHYSATAGVLSQNLISNVELCRSALEQSECYLGTYCNKAALSPLTETELKAPKVILQQLCHRDGRAAPRYHKQPPGGMRLLSAGIRSEDAKSPLPPLSAIYPAPTSTQLLLHYPVHPSWCTTVEYCMLPLQWTASLASLV